MLDKAGEKFELSAENRRLKEELREHTSFANIVARSDTMRQLFHLIKMVAPTDASVLIQGENGTGKELVATAIHEHSTRKKRPFIKINCAAIPSELMESELFGHKRGAFTGAVSDKTGLMELADGGSLLLDEIGEMPPACRSSCCACCRSASSGRSAATASIHAELPADLRDQRQPRRGAAGGQAARGPVLPHQHGHAVAFRRCAIGPRTFRCWPSTSSRRSGDGTAAPLKAIHPDALRVLLRYRWPGNVRELEHVIERAVIVAEGPQITVDDLPPIVQGTDRQPASSTFTIPPHHTLAEIEKLAILQTLERTRGNKRKAAHILGVYRPTLYSKLKKYCLAGHPNGQGEPTSPAKPATRD